MGPRWLSFGAKWLSFRWSKGSKGFYRLDPIMLEEKHDLVLKFELKAQNIQIWRTTVKTPAV